MDEIGGNFSINGEFLWDDKDTVKFETVYGDGVRVLWKGNVVGGEGRIEGVWEIGVGAGG